MLRSVLRRGSQKGGLGRSLEGRDTAWQELSRGPSEDRIARSCRHTGDSWRQIWRVAGRESGSPELLGSPRTSPEVPRTSRKFFGDFPGSSLTVELNSNPEVPRKFPKLPRKFPKLPRKFPDFPGGQPFSLGSLTPSPDSQKPSLR